MKTVIINGETFTAYFNEGYWRVFIGTVVGIGNTAREAAIDAIASINEQ